MSGKNVLIVLLAITTIGLAGFVCYDKLLKEEKKVVCEKCEECEICPTCEAVDIEKEDNSFKTSTGKEMGISYNEVSFTLFGIGYENNQEIFVSISKNLNNEKIKNAKIMTGITSGEDEFAAIVMQNGSVYEAYIGHSNNELSFTQIEKLKDYNIEEIIGTRFSNCDPDSDNTDMCGSRWLVRLKGEKNLKIILNDGTTKSFTGDSNSNNW